jgi:antitoxin component of MazEF toxin-antitoxin module
LAGWAGTGIERGVEVIVSEGVTDMTAVEIKIGDHPALVLPKDVAKSLGLREGQRLHAERLADGSLKIGPYDPHFDKAMQIAEAAMVKYAETLEALAKS